MNARKNNNKRPEQELNTPAKSGTKKRSTARKKKKTRRILVLTIIVSALALLCVVGAAAIMIWTDAPEVDDTPLGDKATDNTPKPGDTLSTPKPTEAPRETAAPETTPAPTTGRREGVYTVLVVGQDVAGMNTDTIMVGMLDTVAHKLNVVSIPRDTLANVTWAVKKINSIYGATGTEEGLVEGISEMIGYKVDSYVVVNIYAFEEIVDAIGGIDFNVPVHMSWGDPTIGKSYDIPAGPQHLNGYNALGVVRFRHNTDGTGYPNGDLGRVETQQKFAVTVAKQMLTLGNIPNLGKVISIVTDNMKTNLSSGNLAFYAQEFLKLKSEDISFSTMPYEPVYIKGGSYVSCQLGPWVQMLNEKLNPYYEAITEENLDVLTYINGDFYSTSGVLAGGYDSFYDYTALTG